jgi:uncharacterized ion transporter superfamily protein YfcC
MSFFLITFLISIFTIALTWTPLATTKIGITNILPYIYKTAAETLAEQGLCIFAFAFFLHAILQSQTFQALFASKRKWLQKRKYFTIGLITICAALLSSSLSWFDEFTHFYPLVTPLLTAMGFDLFSAVLCLYGGSVAGLLGLVSPERINTHFARCFEGVKGKINYTSLTGIGFRLVSFVFFISIVILFNVWYCSRNKQPSISKKNDNLIEEETPPPFNRNRKIILAVASFFLVSSFLAQMPVVADKLRLDEKAEIIPSWVTSEEEKESYIKVGEIEKMKIAKVKEGKEKDWGTFGEWKEKAISCWLIMGGMIICLVAKQSIMENLITAVQDSIPLVLIYIFSGVPAGIISDSGMSKKLAEKLLPETAKTSASVLALISIFCCSFLLTFMVGSTTALATTLVATSAKILLPLSADTLIGSALLAWIGAVIGMAFSPNNGILRASLEKNKITYRQFIKKVWKLGLIMLLVASGLVIFQVKQVLVIKK